MGDKGPTVAEPWVALSVRQPWAALLVAGLKTVEVRTWRTHRRGRVLIHAGKLTDDRPEAWAAVRTAELRDAASLRGGIVGIGELADCRAYGSREAFATDSVSHLNAPEWFRPPRLFGLVFRDVGPVPFYPYTGQTMFFGVDGFACDPGGRD